MDDSERNKETGTATVKKSWVSDSTVPQRFICIRCLCSFSLLDDPFPGRMQSKSEYQYPDLRLKGLFYFLAITVFLIPIFGSLQWNSQPKCSRCFNVIAQLLGID